MYMYIIAIYVYTTIIYYHVIPISIYIYQMVLNHTPMLLLRRSVWHVWLLGDAEDCTHCRAGSLEEGIYMQNTNIIQYIQIYTRDVCNYTAIYYNVWLVYVYIYTLNTHISILYTQVSSNSWKPERGGMALHPSVQKRCSPFSSPHP